MSFESKHDIGHILCAFNRLGESIGIYSAYSWPIFIVLVWSNTRFNCMMKRSSNQPPAGIVACQDGRALGMKKFLVIIG